jgi:hypothetical protein
LPAIRPYGKHHELGPHLPLLRLRADHRCRSSVVEHPLGKGEVVSSILTGSTNKTGLSALCPVQNLAEHNAKLQAEYAPNPHQTSTICSGGERPS